MNKKFYAALQAKCKDFGLSKAAIEDLAKAGSEGITDDTSDEDIEKKVDSLAQYAKLMQAEVTRKAQNNKPTSTNEPTNNGGENGGKGGNGDEEPDWFKKYKTENDERLSKLMQENDALKAEKLKTERTALINATAKKLGIPDFLMKRVTIADDADIEKELTEYKQEIVTNKLMPAEGADILSSSEQAAKDDAKAWANSLPNK